MPGTAKLDELMTKGTVDDVSGQITDSFSTMDDLLREKNDIATQFYEAGCNCFMNLAGDAR